MAKIKRTKITIDKDVEELQIDMMWAGRQQGIYSVT